jgi:predicted Rossmann fold nucleotide-binding protein DprA/Smf involved in DNA uptake
MLGSLDVGGCALGIVADSLLRSATSKKWRRALMDKRLTLISPFQPEAGFNVGNAMARNKYIYCLADSSLVVHSGKKGGTINGAEENLKNGWVPLWVKPTDDTDAANSSLVAKGGQWCAGNAVNLKILPLIETVVAPPVGSQDAQTDMFSDHVKDQTEVGQNGVHEVATSPENTDGSEDRTSPTSLESNKPEFQTVDFYQAFINEISNLSQDDVKTDELVDRLELHKGQVNAWLKRACDEGLLKKLSKPVRYRVTDKM